MSEEDLRLTLEVLHDIQKLIVDVELARKLYFDLIQIAKSILDVHSALALSVRSCGVCLHSR